MSLTRRGKWTAAVSVVVLVGVGVLGFLVITGRAPALIQNAAARIGIGEPAPPPTCPLTGRPAPKGVVRERPALGIKVENIAEARPQVGIQHADLVYEELVEGGITRFIAVFHCQDAGRVGPVRSGRITDAGVLVQFGKPLLGYSGGSNSVHKAIDRTPIIDLNEANSPSAYERDPNRPVPHNLYTSTEKLYRVGKSPDGAPDPVFLYAKDIAGRSRRVAEVNLPFSYGTDVVWRWEKGERGWLRYHGDEPHLLEGDVQVIATNVVVQEVEITQSSHLDPVGNPVPVVTLTGGGKAYVFRGGRMIVGTWERDSLEDLTRFFDRSGNEIALAPGATWIELLPSTAKLRFSK